MDKLYFKRVIAFAFGFLDLTDKNIQFSFSKSDTHEKQSMCIENITAVQIDIAIIICEEIV